MSTSTVSACLRDFRAIVRTRFASLGRRLVHNLAIASEALRFAAPVCSLVGFLVLTATIPAAAQADYPSRPITLIVPFPAGGPSDVVARIVSEHMARTLGRPILVENVLGAGGTIGTLRAARAAADGHTMVLGHMGTHATAVSLYPDLAYKPATDFEAVGLIAGFAVAVVARKDFPASDLKGFMHYAKANPAKLNNAHAGLSSVAYAACLQFNSLVGIKPTLIPYQGAAPFTTALLAGQVDYVCDQVLNSAPHVRSGNLKAFAIASSERSAALPNVPTTSEAGLPEFQFSAWNAFFAPKGTPKPIIEKLNVALRKALDDDKVRARLIDIGADIPSAQQRSPQWLATFVGAEVVRWSQLLGKNGATTDLK
jgi:tripartite-type tricarboxylate transporter receptor subunit TctC